jgi:hypothetical protein
MLQVHSPRANHFTPSTLAHDEAPVPSLAEMLFGMHVVSEYAKAHGFELVFTDALTIDEHGRACRMRPPRGAKADSRPIAIFGTESTVYVNTTWLSAATATPARALWRPYVMIVACLLHAESGPLAIAVRLDTCTSEQKGAVTVKRLPVPMEEMVQLDPQEAALLNLYRDTASPRWATSPGASPSPDGSGAPVAARFAFRWRRIISARRIGRCTTDPVV